MPIEPTAQIPTPPAAEKIPTPFEAQGIARAVLLFFNFFPILHLFVIAILVLCPPHKLMLFRLILAGGTLYLLPPFLAQMIRYSVKIPEGRIPVNSNAFVGWWALFQVQLIFSRWPALEETLRFVPGLYSLWLRLWGAQIGRLTYWAPGTLILDRSFLNVGDNVIFAAGVRVNPHVLIKTETGDRELLLAAIKIGDRAQVGGYSLLTSGTEIPADEVTRAFLISPPFSVWKDGKRVRRPENAEIESLTDKP